MIWLALAGLALWQLTLLFLPERGIIGELEHILRFAVLVLAPLELSLVANADRRGRTPRSYRLTRALYVPCAGAVVLSFVLFPEQGVLAGLLVLPWLGLSLIGAALALGRLLPRGLYPVAELAQDLGLLYWPIGAVWLVASRLGVDFWNFPGKIVLLTAIHFHFAGLAASLFVGQVGRALEYGSGPGHPSRLYRASAILTVTGIPLTAVGIALAPALEYAGALALACGLVTCMGLVLWRLVARYYRKPAGWLLAIAAVSVFVSMFYAFRFATGEFLGVLTVPIDRMIVVHGWWNAVGFAGAGLLALALLRPRMCRAAPGIPFSRLSARGRVGQDFFERHGLVDLERRPEPTGLVDDMRSYAGAGLSVDELHPLVRMFYEHTNRFDLLVTPHWRPGLMRLLARLYARWIGGRLEQMNFPLESETQSEAESQTSAPGRKAARISSRIVALREAADGRPGVRAWVRYYYDTGKAIYAAAYASHRMLERTYMNIAFPLPGGSITSILRLANLPPPDTGALTLTSRPDPAGPGDEGVYFANRWLPLRLPINETISVLERHMPGARDMPRAGAELVARHDMWLWGVRFLTLEYNIRRRGPV
jgi:hypothetical protein